MKILIRTIIFLNIFLLVSGCTMLRWSHYCIRDKKLIATKKVNQILQIQVSMVDNVRRFTAKNKGDKEVYIKSFNPNYYSTFFEKKNQKEKEEWIPLGDIKPGEIYKVTHTIAPRQSISLTSADKKVKSLEKGTYRLIIYYYYGNMKQLYYSYSEPFTIQ